MRGSVTDDRASAYRFDFGKNWQHFLSVVDETRIEEAVRSVRAILGSDSLAGRSFVDVGCGSGLFSLAAARLGASRVHSFDCDPTCVACAHELKRRHAAEAAHWTIEQGNVLDRQYLRGLGGWDVVYAWGVLHHTGNLRQALADVTALVAKGGTLFVSIYNDQGAASRRWCKVKRFYNTGPLGRAFVVSTFVPYFFLRGLAADVVRGRNPTARYRDYKKNRGMSRLHDWLDWLGGYPFEVARPEEVFRTYRELGFDLISLKTCGGGLGCNEYVLVRK